MSLHFSLASTQNSIFPGQEYTLNSFFRMYYFFLFFFNFFFNYYCCYYYCCYCSCHCFQYYLKMYYIIIAVIFKQGYTLLYHWLYDDCY